MSLKNLAGPLSRYGRGRSRRVKGHWKRGSTGCSDGYIKFERCPTVQLIAPQDESAGSTPDDEQAELALDQRHA